MKKQKKKRIFFHEKHPELKEGEIFLTNIQLQKDFMDFFEEIAIFSDDKFSCPRGGDNFSAIGWKTKRMGKIAYDINGNVIDGLVPVFVESSELKKAKIKVYNEFSVFNFKHVG